MSKVYSKDINKRITEIKSEIEETKEQYRNYQSAIKTLETAIASKIGALKELESLIGIAGEVK